MKNSPKINPKRLILLTFLGKRDYNPGVGKILKPIKNKYKNRNQITSSSMKKISAALTLFFLFCLLLPINTGASLHDSLNNVNRKIREVQGELSDIKAEKDDLQGQISVFNAEVSNIEYQISLTNEKIGLLNKRIAQTKSEIQAAEKDLEEAREKLSEFIRVIYEEGQFSTIEVIAKSSSFNEFVNRSEYLEQAQLGVKQSADKVVELKNKLEQQQKELEEDKKETNKLRISQVGQRNEVNTKISAKNNLLAVTRGNESQYQSLLKNLRDEQRRIQNQIWYGGNYVSLGSVKAGDIIGRIGNSGYSTGCHLHFEIRTAGKSHVNPNSYINNGYFIHPVPGVPVSAPYGYSSSYFSGIFHTGIDYADGCAGTAVRAAADGEIVTRVSGRPNTYPWSYEYGNYVMIRHTNGMYSLYAHLR